MKPGSGTFVAVVGLVIAAVAGGCGGDDEALDARPAVDAALDGGAALDGAVRDAAVVDAGPDAPTYGVACGPDGEELCVPGSSLGCCTDDGDAAPGCTPLGGLCLGDLTSCDGPEDCSRELLCCDYGFGPGCGEPLDCNAELGGTVICHGDADCPAEASSCCEGRCAATACP